MNAAVAHARLLLDVVSMKMFVWVLGHNGELLDSQPPNSSEPNFIANRWVIFIPAAFRQGAASLALVSALGSDFVLASVVLRESALEPAGLESECS